MNENKALQFWVTIDDEITEAQKDMNLKVKPDYRGIIAKALFRLGAKVLRSKVSFEYRR